MRGRITSNERACTLCVVVFVVAVVVVVQQALPSVIMPQKAPPLAVPNPVYPLMPRRTFTHKHQLQHRETWTELGPRLSTIFLLLFLVLEEKGKII